jgi:hypothetical protein
MEVAEKCPNTRHQPIAEEAELLSGYRQNVAISINFPLKRYIPDYINKNLRHISKKFKNSQRLLFKFFSMTIYHF